VPDLDLLNAGVQDALGRGGTFVLHAPTSGTYGSVPSASGPVFTLSPLSERGRVVLEFGEGSVWVDGQERETRGRILIHNTRLVSPPGELFSRR
jgi:hypothetical protein